MNEQSHLDNLRHSCAHLLAKAVLELYPGAHNAIGPSIENGFYQDFDMGKLKVSEDDLPKIEKKMKEILPTWKHFEFNEVTIEEARKLFKHNPYKVALAEEFAKDGKKLMTNNPGSFLDLCKMGHVENPSKELRNFKLLSVAGAYWRGSEKNKMLTRIYGTCWPSKEELEKYLTMLAEAKKQDHRKIGKELDLFTFSEYVGAGFPLYTPKGTLVRNLLNNFVESLQSQAGYTQVWTPQVAKAELFKLSGHYDKYKGDMFEVKSHYSKEEFYLKPMNCPHHTQIYASRPRSYKDLPLRYADFAMLYRDEKPGELSGLARVRSFSQDDCHVFCREDQVDEEIDKALQMTKTVMATFGFKYKYRLSTRDPKHPEQYLGDAKTWDRVEKWAEKIMKRNKIEYVDGVGEAAFYAPKMDLLATDALGREWQLSTVQIDFVMPQRFGLVYTDKDGKEKHPMMIHRAIIGSSERFLMILLESLAGALPLWLSPVQVKILPITDKQNKYAESVLKDLKEAGIRAELDDRSESVGKKIRGAELQKVPYMLIVGEKEVATKTVAIRGRNQKDLGAMKLDKLIEKIGTEIHNRSL